MVTSRSGAHAQHVGPPGAVVLPLTFSGDDVALVKALRDGHAGARAALFHRYAKHVERIITHVMGFDAELADILQEVFLRALASIHTLSDPAALQPWLSRVAALTARKVLRTRVRRAWLRRFVDDDEEARYEPAVPGPNLEARQAVRAMYAVLDGLPTDERIAFALRFVDGMELTEVASACGVSLATVKRRLQRAEGRFLASAKQHPMLADWIERGSRWHDR